jgi:RNA 2',3'-cyclic 3'-phosphodiesterase
MGETTRVFFAIEIKERLGQDLVRLQTDLTPELPGCEWVTTMPFHLTLAFLGDVRDRDLNGLHGLVASSVCSFPPCDLELAGLGAFPSPGRPRVVWAGLSARNSELLLNIRKSVVAAAAEAGCPCPDERFHPHVTLGRFKFARRGPCDLGPVVERYRSWSCGEFTADEVIGFASRIAGGRPSYEALSRARLGGKKSMPPP